MRVKFKFYDNSGSLMKIQYAYVEVGYDQFLLKRFINNCSLYFNLRNIYTFQWSFTWLNILKIWIRVQFSKYTPNTFTCIPCRTLAPEVYVFESWQYHNILCVIWLPFTYVQIYIHSILRKSQNKRKYLYFIHKKNLFCSPLYLKKVLKNVTLYITDYFCWRLWNKFSENKQ